MNVKKKNKDTNIERRDRKRSGLRFCSQRSQLDSRQLIKIISRATRRLYEQHSVYMYIYIYLLSFVRLSIFVNFSPYDIREPRRSCFSGRSDGHVKLKYVSFFFILVTLHQPTLSLFSFYCQLHDSCHSQAISLFFFDQSAMADSKTA